MFKISCNPLLCWQFAILMRQEKECRRWRKRRFKVAETVCKLKHRFSVSTSLEAPFTHLNSHSTSICGPGSVCLCKYLKVVTKLISLEVNLPSFTHSSSNLRCCQWLYRVLTSPSLRTPLHNYVPSPSSNLTVMQEVNRRFGLCMLHRCTAAVTAGELSLQQRAYG